MLIIAVLFSLASCDVDDDAVIVNVSPSDTTTTATQELWILNEGGFGAGNASISRLNTETATLENDVFAAVNGFGLGDVAQSITFWNEKGYIVVNNSATIEVVNPETLELMATIEGCPSPRFMAIVDDSKAYVSNYYSDEISIIDLASNTVSGAIDYPVDGFGIRDNIEVVGNRAYVTDADYSALLVIDTATDVVLSELALPAAPRNMVQSASGDLWIYGFDYDENFNVVNPQVMKVDGTAGTLTDSWSITQTITNAYSSVNMVLANEMLYFLLDDVYVSSTENYGLTVAHDLPEGSIYYGFGVNDDGSELFLGDAIDFSQVGTVEQIDLTTGSSMATFEVGVSPSKFYFQ